MAKSDHIHTKDNYVAYFSMHKDINGQKKYVMKVFHWSGAYYFTGYAGLRAANHRFSAWATLFKLNYRSSLFQ
jgi:CMP-N-acetylneuraminic acid synthetase